MFLLYVFIVSAVWLQAVVYEITVNCPAPVPGNVQNYDNILDAVNEAVYPTNNTLYDGNGVVNLKIYGQSYSLGQRIFIDLSSQGEVTDLTIEGADTNPSQFVTIIGASEDVSSVPCRIFNIQMRDTSHLKIKNLRFECNNVVDISTSAINITAPKGQIDFENNIFDTSGSAIYSATGVDSYYPVDMNIKNNTFYRTLNTYPLPDYDTIHFSIDFLGNQGNIDFDISNNTFEHALIPIDLNCYTLNAIIRNNQFSVPEKSYTYMENNQPIIAWNTVRVYASPQSWYQDGISELDLSNNILTNVSLDISTIYSGITNNLFKTISTQTTTYQIMSFTNDSFNLDLSDMQIVIDKNVLFDNINSTGSFIHLYDGGGSVNHGSRPIKATIINNSIFSYGYALLIERNVNTLLDDSHVIESFRNNLIHMQPNASTMIYRPNPFEQPLPPVHPVSIDHCWFTYGYPSDTVNFTCTDCGTGEPNINLDMQNFTYSLIWDTTAKSPCIDAGYPEQYDVLYDRPDIGAIQFDEFPHYTYSYTFPANGGIKWMSFPVLFDVQNNQFVNQELISALLDPLISPDSTTLEYCEWNNIYDNFNDETRFRFFNNLWQPDSLVTSQQGYKVQMLNNNVSERVVEVSGFIPPPQTQIRIYGPHNGEPVENWVGYYSPKVKTVFAAFDNIMDNLYYIQKQDWSMMRDPHLPTHPWLMPTSKPPTVKPGDMFIVKAYQDVNLIWNYEGPPQDQVRPPSPEHFAFVEKIDYIPIFTSFKGSNIPLPKEIAVYINGVCKGAAVVTDSLAQICAYICEDLPANPQLDFVLYYDNKSQGTIADYQIWSPSQNSFVKDKLIANGKTDYYLVNITNNSQGDNPAPRLYLNNYPNPFNPRTTVTYYLPKKDRVKVSIYNAKGQLVKTLVNEFKYAGMQETVWQGDDKSGSRCASGVYYCKLQYKNQDIIKKLVFVK
jgi:hypothetical protein